MANTANIKFYAGAKHSVQITITSGLTLTNYEAKIQVKNNSYDENSILEFNSTSGTSLVILNDTQLLLTIPAELTINLEGSYLFQLMLSNLTDVIKLPVYKFIILESITN